MKKTWCVLPLLALACSACMTAAGRSGAQAIERAAATEIGLGGGGLTTGQRGLHHGNVILFGQGQADVLAQLSAIAGAPRLVAPAPARDCPSGTITTARFGSLQVDFEGGRFVGWTVEGRGGSTLQTYAGLSVGDRGSEIDGDSDVRPVAGSGSGVEIEVDGIGVGLTGPRPDDRVRLLRAGKTCLGGRT